MGSNAIASNDRSLVIDLTEEGLSSESTDDGQFLVTSDVFTIQIGSEKATINQDNIEKLQGLLNLTSFVGDPGGNPATNAADGRYSAVVAGSNNLARGDYSFVGSGAYNKATKENSAVVAGYGNNVASGLASAIINGEDNIASGDYSIAMGSNAIASNDRSLVIDLTEEGLSSESTDDGQFLVTSDVFTIQIGSETATINQENIGKLQALLAGLVPVPTPVPPVPTPVPSNTGLGDDAFIGAGNANTADGQAASLTRLRVKIRLQWVTRPMRTRIDLL